MSPPSSQVTGRGMQRDAEAKQMLEQYLHVGTVAAVADLWPNYKYGTVFKRIRRALDKEISPRVEEYRRIHDIKLAGLMERAATHVDSTDPDVSLKGIITYLQLLKRQADLHGLDAPSQSVVTGEVVSVSSETQAVIRQATERLKVITGANGPAAIRAVE